MNGFYRHERGLLECVQQDVRLDVVECAIVRKEAVGVVWTGKNREIPLFERDDDRAGNVCLRNHIILTETCGLTFRFQGALIGSLSSSTALWLDR
jgi:hypothetical protein